MSRTNLFCFVEELDTSHLWHAMIAQDEMHIFRMEHFKPLFAAVREQQSPFFL
jgi:hypothetical protein